MLPCLHQFDHLVSSIQDKKITFLLVYTLSFMSMERIKHTRMTKLLKQVRERNELLSDRSVKTVF